MANTQSEPRKNPLFGKKYPIRSPRVEAKNTVMVVIRRKNASPSLR